MLELQMVVVAVLAATDRVRARRGGHGDAGAGMVETAIITGLLVAGAIVVIGILVNKATQAANSVQVP